MRILSIETSLRNGSVAVLTGADRSTQLVAETRLPTTERSAQSLIPAIEALLTSCHWRPGDLQLLCVSTGPGSFTGLRIGVTTAKTFAFALGIPIVGVNTLAAIMAGLPSMQTRRWVVLDAQRGDLFVAEQLPSQSEGYLADSDCRLVSSDQWSRSLTAGDLVAGPPLASLRNAIPAEVHFAEEGTWEPRARVVGQVGYDLFRGGKSDDPLQLVPQYFRKSAAEEKASQSHNL